MCKEKSHKLLTNSEKVVLIDFIVGRVDDFDQEMKRDEERRENCFSNSTILGGSYNQLNTGHSNRSGKGYEINHMPPSASYIIPYDNISSGARPAILMIYEDHRRYVTTGQGKLVNHDFPNKEEVRGYMRDEIGCIDFCAALNADLEFLLRSPGFVLKYSDGCIQMVNYCNTLIPGAPCNSDCPYYST